MTTTDLIAPEPLSPQVLGSMSTQQLRAALAQSLTISARHLAYLASVWGELEKRGEDLSDLRTGLAVYLPQIAAGRLDADAVIRFAGQPTVLRSMSSLPLERQKALAAGETVDVLTVGEDGTFTTAKMPAYTLTASQARMVFDGDKLRSVPEQQAVLESVKVSRARRTRPGPDNRVRLDTKADLLRIGRSSATVGEVVACIAQAAPALQQHEPAELSAAIMTKLTEAEARQIKVRAAEAGISQQDFVRSVLVRFAAL